MPPVLLEASHFVGLLIRALGFLLAGFALGHFVLDSFKSVVWQVQIALVLGFFGLLIALTDFATAGSAGAFALGAAGAYLLSAGLLKSGDAGSQKK